MFGKHTGFLSAHALKRCGARGIREKMIVRVLDHCDRDISIGDNCRAFSLSASALTGLKQGGMAADEVEGLRRLVIVWSDRTARVVTAFRADRGRRAHRYFRQY